jgi:hypothetical protein
MDAAEHVSAIREDLQTICDMVPIGFRLNEFVRINSHLNALLASTTDDRAQAVVSEETP